eukprot:gene9184-14242_t
MRKLLSLCVLAAVAGSCAAAADGYAALNGGTTGGAGGNEVEVSTATALQAAICGRAAKDTPIVLRVIGTITLHVDVDAAKAAGSSCSGVSEDKITLQDVSNISIIGGLFHQIGIHLRRAKNVILQDLHVREVRMFPGWPTSNGGDAITVRQSDFLWVDHCTLQAGGRQVAGYDSLIDMSTTVTHVTVSYTAFLNSGRGGLIGSGSSDNANTNITFHHNYYWYIQERIPLLRYGTAHMYNNFYVGISHSGINSRRGANAMVEGNYFKNSVNPLGKFWDSVLGFWEVRDNVWDNCDWVQWLDVDVPAGSSTSDPVSTTDITIPYTAVVDSSSCTPNLVLATAGANRGLRVSDGNCGVLGNPTTPVSDLPDPDVAATPEPYTTDPSFRKVDGFAGHAGTTGGDGGLHVHVEKKADLLKQICNRATVATPLVVYYEEESEVDDLEPVTGPSCVTAVDWSEEISMVGWSNLEIHGYGDRMFTGLPVRIEESSNIVLRSLNFQTSTISVSKSSKIWFDHIVVENAIATDRSLIELVDTTSVTISYSRFTIEESPCAIEATGSTDDVTLHHNNFKAVAQCGVVSKAGKTHVYNNLFGASSVIGINVVAKAEALIENNVFDSTVNPFGTVGTIHSGSWDIRRNVLTNVTWALIGNFWQNKLGGPDKLSSAHVLVPYTDMMDQPACTAAAVEDFASDSIYEPNSDFSCDETPGRRVVK